MAYVNNPGGPGIIFFPTSPRPTNWMEEENPDGQFYLWSPLMIFSLVMACVVGLIILILLLYFLFYYCVYGTCCCPGMSCWWCPQAAPAQEEPVKVHVRRPSRSDSCRSSVRSRSSSVCSHRDYDDRKLVRINSCPSVNESVMGVQPMIIQTIPAIQAPQVYQQPIIQAAPAPLPPPAPPASSGFNGELRVVIGESRPAASARSDNVIVYDMARSNGSGITLEGRGGGRREYEMTSVDDFGGTYRGGAFNGGFDRDDGGSFLSEGHRSAVIDIGKGGGNFYPSLPHYDD